MFNFIQEKAKPVGRLGGKPRVLKRIARLP